MTGLLEHTRRLLPGMTVIAGSVLVAASISAAARGLHGYEDVFQLLALFEFGVFCVRLGWWLSR